MWCDETQAWLIARDSHSLVDLFSNLRYEGHPAFWYLLLWPLARISGDPVLMQLLSGAIAVTTIAIVLWHAPLTRIEKILFPLGYFSLYEYAVKSRSYGAGLLLVLLICASWRSRRSHPIRMAFLLAALANVHVLFTLVSIAFFLSLAFERIRGREGARSPLLVELTAIAIVVAGWVAAFVVAWPPPDSGFAVEWFLRPSLTRLWQVTGGDDPYVAGSGLVVAMAAIGILRMRRDIATGAFLGMAVVAVVAFLYVKYIGYIWHRGAIFAAVVAAIWLGRIRGTALFPRFVVPAFLVAQAVAGIQAVSVDLLHPLSAGRAVATFLEDRGWGDAPLIGVHDYAMSPVLAYLGRHQAFYPYSDAACRCRGAGRWGSFTRWDRVRLPEPDDGAILDAAETLGPDATILLPLDRDDSALRAAGFLLIRRFPDQRDGLTFAVYRRVEHAPMR